MFLKRLFSVYLKADFLIADDKIWVVYSEDYALMSPKTYKRYSRLQKSPLLKIMFDN